MEKRGALKSLQNSRLELRIPREKKDYYEEMASLGGFKTLTDFILFSAEQQAGKISEEHNRVLASRKDQQLFFDAITNPPAPNQALKRALKSYKETLSSK